LGVKNTLAGIKSLDEKSDLYGDAFEHFIALELRAYLSYRRILDQSLSYWRSRQGHEVDFLVGDKLAIEVKSTDRVKDKHLVGLKALQEEGMIQNYFLVSRDPIKRKKSNITLIYWKDFLKLLWTDKFALPCK
jgi:predicted AAA+ superfamily ATPase